MSAPEVHIAAVVSTIGRPGPLRHLIRSLEVQDRAGLVELVVIDQSPDQRCLKDLDDDPPRIPYRLGTSPRGVSTGRNAGAALTAAPLLTFPDDNCWYAPDTAERAVAAVNEDPSRAAISGILRTGDGRPALLRWQKVPGPVTRENLNHTAIESSTFIRREWFDTLGGFDEGLGVGSPGPFQAGEGTDLLLRLLGLGAQAHYDPRVVVHHDDEREHPGGDFTMKMLGYGRGFGLIYQRHQLSRAQFAYAVTRKVGAAALRTVAGQRMRARADMAWARGAVQGYRGLVT